MKTFYKTLLPVIAACIMLVSCSKKSDTNKPAGDISALAASSWTVSAFGGVAGNPLTFSVNKSTAVGTVTAVGSQPFGFAVGDQLFTNITANTDGTYSAKGKYTYGTNSSSSSTRSCTLSLQNNNTQLTAFYPAINSSFPAITYVYQQSATIIELP
jgi:hypothetical protein